MYYELCVKSQYDNHGGPDDIRVEYTCVTAMLLYKLITYSSNRIAVAKNYFFPSIEVVNYYLHCKAFIQRNITVTYMLCDSSQQRCHHIPNARHSIQVQRIRNGNSSPIPFKGNLGFEKLNVKFVRYDVFTSILKSLNDTMTEFSPVQNE